MTLFPHGGDDPAGQVVPAKEIRLELLAQYVDWNIFYGPRLAIGPVVEERSEFPVGSIQRLVGALPDRARIPVLELKDLEAFGLQSFDVVPFARRGQHAPSALLHAVRARIANARRATGDENGS